jgi:hypothetical protein
MDNETAFSDRNDWTDFLIIFVVVVLLQTIFLHSPGTVDVNNHLRWMNAAWTDGLNGYRAVKDYPPLSFLILYALTFTAHAFDLNDFVTYKIFIVLFCTATFILAAFSTRDLLVSVSIFMLCFISGVLLGYIDVFYAPFLILSLHFFRRNRVFLTCLLLLVASLTKWQPLIIAPFVIVYFSRTKLANLFLTSIPLIFLVGLVLFVFGSEPIRTFNAALSHERLSGSALNNLWLYAVLLDITPKTSITNLGKTAVLAPYSFKIAFFVLYLYFLVLTYRRANVEDTVYYSVICFFGYYLFNYGVHENHLFVPAIVALMFINNSKKKFFYSYVAFMAVINMVVMYGFFGTFDYKPTSFPELTAGLSIANLVVFLREIFHVFLSTKYLVAPSYARSGNKA